ncbi:hypothetical protein INT46_005017 [Mucor plumbeus]|uniref:Uncharacterized protein n=1 Tax=Mucor plumbeus TaxID=97098 RepID=A0A8H7QVH0_9FUNG|nr:hypothetical protein INT46_005017 [Mucor plumbeus]
MASEDKSSENQLTNTEDVNIMNAVGSNIQGVQNTLGTLFSRIEQNSRQTFAMSKGMVQMMEQEYKANMRISSTFEPAGNGNVRMSLIIDNGTQLPATSMTGVLEFKASEIDVLFFTSYQNNDENQPLPNLFQSSCDLAPQAKYTQVIEIRTKEIKQCNGSITLNLMNPLLPQESIELKHNFGLYLIDQFKIEILDHKKNLKIVDNLYYPVNFLRDIFKIHPINGINYGTCISLSSPKCIIICEITNVAEDHNTVEVEFTSNNQELAQMLIAELSSLCVE